MPSYTLYATYYVAFALTDTVFCVILLITGIWFLGIFDRDEYPNIVLNAESSEVVNGIQLKEILRECLILHKRYKPPSLWGRNGHLQTLTYGVFGHASLKRDFDKRYEIMLADGTTITFDVFEASRPHPNGNDYTLAICPGICNSSESNYIRTCVHEANKSGYRAVVLNHIGVLPNMRVTTPRIFSYGSIEEFDAMITKLMQIYPKTKFFCVGFSLGANIVTNFMASLTNDMLPHFLVGLSVCQGYDAEKIAPAMFDWLNGRRLYNFIIANKLKRLLRRNFDKVVAPHIKSGLVSYEKVFGATSLYDIDEYYNRRVLGFDSVNDMYYKSSSIHRINDIKIPMVFLNCIDDPLFPLSCIEAVKEICANHSRHAFISLKHGGHLGFLEGPSFKPRDVTWLDRFLVQMADVTVKTYEKSLKMESF